jgi:hypothetical protein
VVTIEDEEAQEVIMEDAETEVEGEEEPVVEGGVEAGEHENWETRVAYDNTSGYNWAFRAMESAKKVVEA